VILLDTNAVIWLDRKHRRAKCLSAATGPLFVSPATLVEVQLLNELGRIHFKPGSSIRSIIDDGRWTVDDPPSIDWFSRATEESWTRDPFDRLIVAHARLRGWRLATGDQTMLERLRPSERVEL
jgi:PIN domain nuclease of toxin-antitoxin system